MTHVNKQSGLADAIRGCASWQEIQAKWRTFPEKQKGDLFEELVKAYLQLEPEYASKLKHVWLGGEVPQAIARKLKLPATDQGIDIVVPSLALIRQTLKVWLRETMANKQAVEWICVCSDESAGRVERDDSAVLRQDPGVPCLTDPKEIAAWLTRKHPGLTVVFTTYQSG